MRAERPSSGSSREGAGRGAALGRPANWGLQSSHGGRRFLLRNASGTLKVSEIYVCNTSESFLRTRLLFLKGRVEKEIIFVYVLFCIIRSLYLLASSTHVKQLYRFTYQTLKSTRNVSIKDTVKTAEVP